MMLTILLIVLTIFGLGDTPPEWQRVEADECGFTISMPAPPDVMAQNESHLFLGTTGGAVLRFQKDGGAIDLRIPLTQTISAGVTHRAHNPVVTDDGLLYVPTDHFKDGQLTHVGSLLVYDAANGQFQWSYLSERQQIPVPGYSDSLLTDAQVEEVAIQGDLAVITQSDAIVAFDRHSGEERWRTFFGEVDGFTRGLAIHNGVVYVGSVKPHLYALDLSSGNVLWKTREHPIDASITTLLEIEDGRVYFKAGGQIWVFDTQDGRLLYRRFPPEFEAGDRDAIFTSVLAVEEGYMVNVGYKKVYALVVP